MEETHHLPTIMDSKMEEEVKMETLSDDFSAGAADETHQHPANEGPSCSHRKFAGSSRPRLKSMKSFPPYSQCIGGIGEDSDRCDNVPDSQLSTVHHASFRNELGQSMKRKEDFKKNARCGDMKSKWKMRRGRLGRSWEIDSSRWEREENSVREREHDDKERDGGTNIEWKHYTVRNSSMEREQKEDEEKMRCLLSAVEGENDGSEGTPKDEEAEEMLGIREDPTAQESPSPHPILSKILQSSSTSSCSSISLSSGESDDIFSEGEDAERKKRMLKKVSSVSLPVTFNFWHFINTLALCLCMQLFHGTDCCFTCGTGHLHGFERKPWGQIWMEFAWLLMPLLLYVKAETGREQGGRLERRSQAAPFHHQMSIRSVDSSFKLFNRCDQNLFKTQIWQLKSIVVLSQCHYLASSGL